MEACAWRLRYLTVYSSVSGGNAFCSQTGISQQNSDGAYLFRTDNETETMLAHVSSSATSSTADYARVPSFVQGLSSTGWCGLAG